MAGKNDFRSVELVGSTRSIIMNEAVVKGQAITYSGYIYNGTTHIDYAGICLDDNAVIGDAASYSRYGDLYVLCGGNFAVGDNIGLDATGRAVQLIPVVGNVSIGSAIWANTAGAGGYTLIAAHKDLQQNFIDPGKIQEYFVDGSRVDVYVEDGTYTRPYQTIAAALTRIITNADNAAAYPYVLTLAPAIYAENIVIASALINNITIQGTGEMQETVLTGNITNIVNNDAMNKLCFSNMRLCGNITVTGQTTGTTFDRLIFDNVVIDPAVAGAVADRAITITNISHLIYVNCYIYQNIAYQNIIDVTYDNCTILNNTNTYTVITNTGVNIPLTYTGIIINAKNTLCQINHVPTVTAGTIHHNIYNSEYGTAVAFPVAAGATVTYFTPFENVQDGQTIYVDMSKPYTFVGSGTKDRPYITIQAAVNRVVANANNTAAYPYVIKIAPGVYPENVLINNALFTNVVLEGTGQKHETALTGNFTCIVNNDLTTRITIKNMRLCGNITITGENTATQFDAFELCNCLVEPAVVGAVADRLVAITNIENLFISETTEIFQNVALQNISGIWLDGVVMYANTNTLTITSDDTLDIPLLYAGTIINARTGVINVDPINVINGTGTIHYNVFHCHLGAAPWMTCIIGVTVQYHNQSRIGIKYDFAVHGGVSTVLGLFLPDNLVITRAFYDCSVALDSPTGPGNATMAINSNGAADLLIAAAVSASGTAGLHECIPVGTMATAVKMTADRNVGLTFAVEALNAGEMFLILDTVQSE